VRAFLALWREIITSTDFQAGCPVLAVSIEESADGERPAVLTAAAGVFSGWEAQSPSRCGSTAPTLRQPSSSPRSSSPQPKAPWPCVAPNAARGRSTAYPHSSKN
jgi:hypothetical protein